MPRYNEYVVDRVAEAIFKEIEPYLAWGDLCDTWDSGYGAGKDHYRNIAIAALAAIDSLYESEAEEPVEYAGIEGGL